MKFFNLEVAFNMQKILKCHLNELESEGFCLVRGFFSGHEMKELKKNLHIQSNTRFCLGKIPILQSYAKAITNDLSQFTKNLAFNRSIFFNKTPKRNWAVLWHQDLTICVKERVETEAYGPWSLKDGIPHVQPPLHILSSMITTRLHIDPASSDNGALKVIPQSHQKILARNEIESLTKNPRIIEAEQGDLLLMKPLLLHSSESSSLSSFKRRILHLEFLTQKLSNKLSLFHS